ncbi:MAG: hypothetical protein ABJF27_02100 [Crocinitomicaceae bacterium]
MLLLGSANAQSDSTDLYPENQTQFNSDTATFHDHFSIEIVKNSILIDSLSIDTTNTLFSNKGFSIEIPVSEISDSLIIHIEVASVIKDVISNPCFNSVYQFFDVDHPNPLGTDKIEFSCDACIQEGQYKITVTCEHENGRMGCTETKIFDL